MSYFALNAQAQALRYFRMSDPDGSGEIDFEEFKVALFAVDPDSGNPVGFAPNALLSPLDAFEVGRTGKAKRGKDHNRWTVIFRNSL